VSPALALWMSPVAAGLALAIPIAALTDQRDAVLARLGLLRIPEENQPPPVLARAASLSRPSVWSGGAAISMPDRLIRDRELLDAHREMLPPSRVPWVEPPEIPLLAGRTKLEEAPCLSMAWQSMTREERTACLADGPALELMVARSRERLEPA